MTKPKRAYHHGDLKNALIETALAHIARDGARALSLREVARNAGVSHTASYRHFPNKESLLAAIAEQGFHLLNEAMRAAIVAQADDLVRALHASGVAYVEFGVRYPEHLQVMFGGLIARTEDYPTLAAASNAGYQLLAGIVREGLRAGRMRGPDERSVALAAWSLVHGLAVLLASRQIRPAPTAAELATVVIDLLHQGITVTTVPADARPRKSGSREGRKSR
jgi:AcrR family transcriptional regulator